MIYLQHTLYFCYVLSGVNCVARVLDALEDNDDVQAVYHNWENDDE